jgi:hypothetical protein
MKDKDSHENEDNPGFIREHIKEIFNTNREDWFMHLIGGCVLLVFAIAFNLSMLESNLAIFTLVLLKEIIDLYIRKTGFSWIDAFMGYIPVFVASTIGVFDEHWTIGTYDFALRMGDID